MLEVREVAGEAPAGIVAHGRGGEGIEAELGSTSVDVLSDGLESLKVRDVAKRVAGLFEQVFIDDDAERTRSSSRWSRALPFGVIEVVGVGVELVGNGGAAQVIAVVAQVSTAAWLPTTNSVGGANLSISAVRVSL